MLITKRIRERKYLESLPPVARLQVARLQVARLQDCKWHCYRRGNYFQLRNIFVLKMA